MSTQTEFNAWSPGIQSQLPREVLPFSSILNPDNIFQTFAEIEELHRFTGINQENLAAFKPERLATHELLIRVMSNYSVSDGNQYSDLGVNFREMTQILLDKYIQPQMSSVIIVYQTLYKEVCLIVESELNTTLYEDKKEIVPEQTFWQKMGFQKRPVAPTIDPVIRDAEFLKCWDISSLSSENDTLSKLIYKTLNSVCASVMGRHGRIRGAKDVLITLVARKVCNDYGSDQIGELIEPLIVEGAEKEGFRLLPIQPEPTVMNVKGSSASGKSTLRPLQNRLAQKLNLHWDDFALISPDIFRKFLLDYDSLGDAYKYAGICAGLELKIVDQKLDRYIDKKARRAGVPHLLIDRFRFDSFIANSRVEGSNLLTRFGSTVYMFYMLTPPHETVERAYTRGLKVGRFKSVDDLLDHNVETFSGMPEIFFTWALNKNKDVHYEFLDNTVELGQPPRIVACGRNGVLSIFDVDYILNVDRFRKIDINANSADTVYPQEKALLPENNLQFLNECVHRLDSVNFVVSGSRQIAARVTGGVLDEWSVEKLTEAIPDAQTRSAMLSLFKSRDEKKVVALSALEDIELDNYNTVGSFDST